MSSGRTQYRVWYSSVTFNSGKWTIYLDIALLVFLEDEESSEEENRRSEENVMFKNRATEGAFRILVRRHLNCNDEKFRPKIVFKLGLPVLF